MYVQSIRWPKGVLTAVWSDKGLCRLVFGAIEEADAMQMTGAQARHGGPQALQAAVQEYFAGGQLDFSLEHLDWTGTPKFHRAVLQRCAKIPRGAVLTYGELAKAVGKPAAARAVGQAMARNRWPLIVPCHRVVGHSGKLTGYSGQGGTDTKQWLLECEGADWKPQKAKQAVLS